MAQFLTTLDRHALTAMGIDGWSYGMRDRVRFGELDALNHVNNVVFLRWFESIRVSYIQDYGFTAYGPDDPFMVVRRVTADYHAPMFQNEAYVVTARTTVIKPSSFVMEYAVFSDTLRATGEAVVISLERDGKTRRMHAPGAIEAVKTRDGAKVAD
ncbi:MAG: thioesterase family protein [Pseudomonadota bacterium]